MSNRGFKWKLIDNKLKEDKDKGKLGEEKYQVVVFFIFKLVLFLLEAARIINIEAVNAFVEYERTNNNSSAVLVETLLFLNRYRLYKKGVMWCCVPLLFMWIVSHLRHRKKFSIIYGGLT